MHVLLRSRERTEFSYLIHLPPNCCLLTLHNAKWDHQQWYHIPSFKDKSGVWCSNYYKLSTLFACTRSCQTWRQLIPHFKLKNKFKEASLEGKYYKLLSCYMRNESKKKGSSGNSGRSWYTHFLTTILHHHYTAWRKEQHWTSLGWTKLSHHFVRKGYLNSFLPTFSFHLRLELLQISEMAHGWEDGSLQFQISIHPCTVP